MKKSLITLLFFLLVLPAFAVTTQFTDNFNRADSTELGTDWTTQVGNSLQIVSQRVRSLTAGTFSVEVIGTTLGNDQFAQITLSTFTGAAVARTEVEVRGAAPTTDTGYSCGAARNHTFSSRIAKLVTGTVTSLVEETATTWAATDVLRCEVSGSNIRLYRNGSPLLTVNDTELTSGQAGLKMFVASGGNVADNEADDFIAGDFDWQSIGTLGSVNSKTADQTSLALTTTAACEAAKVCACAVAVDNNGTGDGDEGAVTSITDSASNTWAKVIEFANGQGTAQTGAVAYLAYTKATTTIASGGTITANFSNSTSRDASAMTCWEFQPRANYTISSAGTATLATDGADPGAITISSLTSAEYLWLHGLASETNNAAAFTQDADYTSFDANGTSATPPAFDVATESATWTTTPDPFTFSHAAAASGVKAAMVFIFYEGVSTDLITSVSYGGATMTRVSIACDTTGEPGCAIAYHLGASLAQGTQTVSIDHTATATVKIATAVTMTGGFDTETCATGTLTADVQNPQIAVNCTNTAQRYFVIYSGHNAPTDLTLISGMSAISDHDFGTKTGHVDRQTGTSSGSTTVGYTDTAADDVGMIAFGVSSIDVVASNMSVRGGFRIFSGTTDTVDVTRTAVDHAQVFAAVKAEAPVGGTLRNLGLLGVGQ